MEMRAFATSFLTRPVPAIYFEPFSRHENWPVASTGRHDDERTIQFAAAFRARPAGADASRQYFHASLLSGHAAFDARAARSPRRLTMRAPLLTPLPRSHSGRRWPLAALAAGFFFRRRPLLIIDSFSRAAYYFAAIYSACVARRRSGPLAIWRRLASTYCQVQVSLFHCIERRARRRAFRFLGIAPHRRRARWPRAFSFRDRCAE